MSVLICSSALVTGACLFTIFHGAEGPREGCTGPPWGTGELSRWALDRPHRPMHGNHSVPALFCSGSGFVRRKGSLALKCSLIPDVLQTQC